MQVVFVHGVNTRDSGDGSYDRWVAGRSDRLNRLAFDQKATIRFPYWGKFGLAETTLRSIPKVKGAVQALGLSQMPDRANGAWLVAAAKRDFPGTVASLSVEAIGEATLNKTDAQRHEIEDFWMAAAAYADARPVPGWLGAVGSHNELGDRIAKEVAALRNVQSLGAGWMPSLPSFDLNAIAADTLRSVASGYLAQFLGDALMFFSRRDKSAEVRAEISRNILDAAKASIASQQPLILIGHSMGGSILHELLTDPEAVAAFETELGEPLKVDLFLGVGTQVGLFAELNQFATPPDKKPLAISVSHYWNIYDYADTLAFLSEPVVPGTIDFEVSTAAGVAKAHTAYFDNALFFSRLNKRLKEARLLIDAAA